MQNYILKKVEMEYYCSNVFSHKKKKVFNIIFDKSNPLTMHIKATFAVNVTPQCFQKTDLQLLSSMHVYILTLKIN